MSALTRAGRAEGAARAEYVECACQAEGAARAGRAECADRAEGAARVGLLARLARGSARVSVRLSREVSRVRMFHVKHLGAEEAARISGAFAGVAEAGLRARRSHAGCAGLLARLAQGSARALAALALVAACTGPAWAAEGDEASDPNTVNPQQMPDSSFIYDTSIADLYSADSYLNNQTVQVVGEVVGDRINAEFDSANCWIALQAVDGSNADIPVFMTKEASRAIDRYGAYGVRGTTLQVRGIFHLTCPEHDGLTDLHADHVSVVKKGEDLREAPDPSRFVPGALAIALGLVLIVVFYRLRESQR